MAAWIGHGHGRTWYSRRGTNRISGHTRRQYNGVTAVEIGRDSAEAHGELFDPLSTGCAIHPTRDLVAAHQAAFVQGQVDERGHFDARCRSFQMFDRAAAGIGGADQRTRRGADHDVWSDPALLECAQNTDVGEATQSTATEHQGYGSAGIRYCLGVLADRLQPEGSKRSYRGFAGMCPSPHGSGDERRCQEQSEDRHPMTRPPSGPDPSCQRVYRGPANATASAPAGKWNWSDTSCTARQIASATSWGCVVA